ncbi:MAG: tetratricopeptide repeat protein [Desulfovibrionaceae bacterium]
MRPLTLVLTLAWVFALVGSCLALQVSFRTRADTDVLTFALQGADTPKGAVKRVGPESLSVTLPSGERLDRAENYGAGRLVRSVTPTPDGLIVNMRSNAFGYIVTPVPGQTALQIQVFRDPIGARWRPEPPAEATPTPQPAPQSTQKTAPVAVPVPSTPAVPVTELPAEKIVPPDPLPEQTVLAIPAAEPRPANLSLFAVPYAVRVPVTGLENEVLLGPSEQVESEQNSGLPRYKAVNEASEPAPPSMVRPAATESLAVPPTDATSTPPVDGEGVSSGIFRRMLVNGLRPPPAAVVVPPPVVSPGDQAGTEQAVASEAVAAPGEAAAVESPAVADVAVQKAVEDIQSGEAQSAEPPIEGEPVDPTTEEAKRLENLQLDLIKAQSQVASGKLDAAQAALQTLLAQPDLPQNIRQEALYTLGGVLMTLYKDNPAAHFEEITGVYKEAMNANLRSDNLPQALMNLGLVNLWAGNVPEAKGYFDLLTSQFPNNENVPAIEYYWGEYYYRLGDWEEAADRFQGFIEKYPEQERLARQAAFHLAEALQNLGMYEQAFQIVDYIDKRWPQVFESNPGFLKLAGDVEFRLDMLDRAKSHYWTYYNINPKAEEADVVLARIGDVYLRKNEKNAARTIYERAAEDYPDLEGGLVAKMRLAEEGIYDEPTMVEMVTVFDRPYNLRPKQVYTEIVDQYPDSPLAPLALLKLGMWHFFQKEYPEAMAAAQRLLTEYPRSPLVERARELGDRAFALAVPQLIQEQNYQTVVDYWEQYDFIDASTGAEGNSTRLGVAQSYGELDEYEKALDLLEPFLTKNQVPDYSEMALALAAKIYLEQRAWNRINELSALVEANWQLTPRTKRLLMHANAVASENLGDREKSTRLWAQLGADEDVEDFIRADALYYMAKEAMNHDDLRRVFVYAQEALSLLLASKGDDKKIKDCLLMSIFSTERSGRYRQALKWAIEYNKYIAAEDPEWAASRYKLAEIYRKAGFPDEWKRVMEELRDAQPQSLYGRLAATAIETGALEERAQEYAPIPN